MRRLRGWLTLHVLGYTQAQEKQIREPGPANWNRCLHYRGEWKHESENLYALLEVHLSEWGDDETAVSRAARLIILSHYPRFHLDLVHDELFWCRRLLAHPGRIRPAVTRIRLLCHAMRAASVIGSSHDYGMKCSRELQALIEQMGETRFPLNLCHQLIDMARLAHHTEQDELARHLFEAALKRLPETSPRIAALTDFAEALRVQGEPEKARTCYEEALQLARRMESAWQISGTQALYGSFLAQRGELKAAVSMLDDALAVLLSDETQEREGITPSRLPAPQGGICRELGLVYLAQGRFGQASLAFGQSRDLYLEMDDPQSASAALRGLGLVEMHRGNLPRAGKHFEEGIVVWRENAHRRWQAIFLLHLAEVAYHAGNDAETLRLLEEAEGHIAHTNAPTSRAVALYLRARLALRRGDTNAALALHREGLALRRRYGGKKSLIESGEGIAAALAAAGEAAASLLGAMHAARRQAGMPLPPVERAERDRAEATARCVLSDEDWGSAWNHGNALNFDAALELMAP